MMNMDIEIVAPGTPANEGPEFTARPMVHPSKALIVQDAMQGKLPTTDGRKCGRSLVVLKAKVNGEDVPIAINSRIFLMVASAIKGSNQNLFGVDEP